MTLDSTSPTSLACFLIAVIPGPTVTVIIANSLAHGTRAGLLNVAGTQLGLGLMMGILVVGLTSVIAAMGWLFDWLRIGRRRSTSSGWAGSCSAPPTSLDEPGAAAPRRAAASSCKASWS